MPGKDNTSDNPVDEMFCSDSKLSAKGMHNT